MIRIASYGRISGHVDQLKTGRSGEKLLSLDAQAEQCHRFALAHKGVITHTFSDVGSGWKLTRKDYLELRDLARKGAIDAVLVYKLDRFARDNADGIARCDELESLGVEIWSVIEGVNIAKFMRDIHFSVAANESASIADRTRPILRGMAERGLWVTRPPYGYRMDPQRPGHMIVHDYEADIVRQIVGRFLDGQSVYSLTQWLNSLVVEGEEHTYAPAARNGKKEWSSYWDANTIKHILLNSAYAGWVEYDRRSRSRRRNIAKGMKDPSLKIRVKGLHPPLISEEDYDNVRARIQHRPHVFSRSSTKAALGRRFLLRGLMRCGVCNRSMEAHYTHTSRGVRREDYAYRCTSRSHSSIWARRLHDEVFSALDALQIDSEFLAWARDIVAHEEQNPKASQRATLQAERKRLLDMRTRIEDKLASGTMSDAAYQRTSSRIEENLARVEAELGQCQEEVPPKRLLQEAEQFLARLVTARPVFETARQSEDPEILEQVALALSTVIERIVWSKSEGTKIVWRSWAAYMVALKQQYGEAEQGTEEIGRLANIS